MSQQKQRVRLELYASKLKNVAGFGKGTSDPFAVVTQLASDPNEQPHVLGKTEVIKNSLSPHWTTHFDLDYEIGLLTRINVAIFDEVRKSKTHKQMGSVMFEVGQVLGTRGNTKAKKLHKGGTVFARITNAPQNNAGFLRLQLQGVKLKNTDGMFGKSDPFFELSAQVTVAGSQTWQKVYRSQHIENDLNPKWESTGPIDLHKLCNGDLNRPILLAVWDWEKNGKHQPMGNIETSVTGLMESVAINSGAQKEVDVTKSFVLKRRGKDFGKLVVTEAGVEGGVTAAYSSEQLATPQVSTPMPAPSSSILPQFGGALDQAVPDKSATAMSPPPSAPNQAQSSTAAAAASAPFVPDALPPPMAPPPVKPNFIDYLSGGLELEMCVAIDFTGSNGDPRQPGTLHYINPNGEFNDYEKALTAIGSIIDRYDSDHKYPVYGFGAKYSGKIQHCFQVGPHNELDGIGAIVEAYRAVFRTGLTMSGPTVFSECINTAAASARSRQEEARRYGQQAYKVLLILSDGAVTSIEDTKQALAAASDAPLSVVIVGVGAADFSSMQFLDDFQVGAGNGRDICQFVAFNKCKHDKSILTRETLAEIPDQLVHYFDSRGIKPLPPMMAQMNESFCVSEAGTGGEEEINLNLEFSPAGEVSLTNHNNAVYDDSKYDTYATFKPSAPPAPMSQPHTKNAYVPQGQQPSTPLQTNGYTSQAQQQAFSSYQQPPTPYQQQSHQPYASLMQQQQSQSPFGASPPPPAAAAPPVFHVQVPPGVVPGTQLQVKNPSSGQEMIVTIPPGIGPGQTFAVQY